MINCWAPVPVSRFLIFSLTTLLTSLRRAASHLGDGSSANGTALPITFFLANVTGVLFGFNILICTCFPSLTLSTEFAIISLVCLIRFSSGSKSNSSSRTPLGTITVKMASSRAAMVNFRLIFISNLLFFLMIPTGMSSGFFLSICKVNCAVSARIAAFNLIISGQDIKKSVHRSSTIKGLTIQLTTRFSSGFGEKNVTIIGCSGLPINFISALLAAFALVFLLIGMISSFPLLVNLVKYSIDMRVSTELPESTSKFKYLNEEDPFSLTLVRIVARILPLSSFN